MKQLPHHFFVLISVLILGRFNGECRAQGTPISEYTIQMEAREKGGQTIAATFVITSQSTGKVQRGTSPLGSYTVALPAGDSYRVEAIQRGYRPAQKLLRLDRVSDSQQARQTVVLVLEREAPAATSVRVTVIDAETRQLIAQKLSVQIQTAEGERVNLTGAPREGRFTFLADFGRKVRLVVSSPGYQPNEYLIDVRDLNELTLPLRRLAQTPVAEQPAPQPTAPAAVSPSIVTPPARPATELPSTATPPPATSTPMTKSQTTVNPPVSASAASVPLPSTVKSELATLAEGKTITLDNVYFDQSSYLLRPESYAQLDQLVTLLKERPALKIEVAGHTDNVGDARLNLALSENRARVITSYLTRKGIPESRLRYKGYGQTRPIAPNTSEENKRKNRRVEVRVVE